MTFGNQTVVFVTLTEDLNNRDKYNTPVVVRTEVPVAGCRFRPLTAKEKFDLGTDVVTDPQKITAPPVAAVVGASANDEVIYGGETFQLVGPPRVYTDMGGTPHKVTLIVQRQTG
jgi:hypothetical protein